MLAKLRNRSLIFFLVFPFTGCVMGRIPEPGGKISNTTHPTPDRRGVPRIGTERQAHLYAMLVHAPSSPTRHARPRAVLAHAPCSSTRRPRPRAVLVHAPCSSTRHAHSRTMLIPEPEAVSTPERNRCIQYWGSGVQDRAARLPGQGDDRLHRRVIRGPAAVELGDVDTGP